MEWLQLFRLLSTFYERIIVWGMALNLKTEFGVCER